MKFSSSLALAAAAPFAMALSIGDPATAWSVKRDHPVENGVAGGTKQIIEIDPNNLLGGLKQENNAKEEEKKEDNKDDNKKEDNKDDNKGKNNNGGNNGAQVIIIWVNNGGGAATTTVNEKVTVTQTVTAGAGEVATTAPAAAATHTVTVGGPGGLIYQPDQLSVPVGDTVEFEFLSQNHTVSQSAFEKPCALIEGGMDSGFMANPNNSVSPPPRMAMQVMVETPLWFYCKQGNHCGEGMVFSINPTQEKTQAQFQQLAIEQNGNGGSTPITDPNATPPAQEVSTPTASLVSPPAATGEMAVTPGQGTVAGDGSCTCVVSCSSNSFPAAIQGVGSFGGLAGALPLNMAGM